jgi:NADH-quinone oxidoreductase subunit G
MSVPIEGERNILELCRKAGIELPTFCYHTEISIYGACRMCMVDVDGKGIVPACSTTPEDGMVISTNTKRIRDMRKMIIELMLANHDHNCFVCSKSGDCRLQSISKQLGVNEVRFKQMGEKEKIDDSSLCIQHDPAKCILCGDCVRVCTEIQSIGALGFSFRGAKSRVSPSFGKGLGQIECVGCGQCVKVCPVGALTPKLNIEDVRNALYDESKTVVVQIAPAVRVALGEHFGKEAGILSIGKIITALRRMGFDQVFDTCFGADLTVLEEGKEFLARKKEGKNLPIFTSCCPSWVKFAEQYYPDMLPNLSSCKSPAQMLGAVIKDRLPGELNIKREDLVVVSVMPCTAKKFEAARDEFKLNGNPEVDHVITTSELALMMKEAGIDFERLELGSFDMPFGFSTGAGVIFGSSGGVTEAVLRFAADSMEKGSGREFRQVRGDDSLKITEVVVGNETLRLGVVSGLGQARRLTDRIRRGEIELDIVEVMACYGGCVNGGGQPLSGDRTFARKRAKGLYDNDKMLQFHVSSDSPYIQELYSDHLTGHKAHDLLHTTFSTRKRIEVEDFVLGETSENKVITLVICFGTSCFLRGAQALYTSLMEYIREKNLTEKIEFKANFCGKMCKKGPVLEINGKIIEHCTPDAAKKAIEELLG